MSELSLRVFVYGTLKRGLSNHSPLCDGAESIVPARVWGRLYDLPAGYPAVVIPDAAVLACGTASPRADVVTQHRTTVPESPCCPDFVRPDGDWDEVWGEVLTFPDAEAALPGLDLLEEFSPDLSQPCLYQRVLVPVVSADGVSATWIYTMGDPVDGVRIRNGVWPLSA